MEEEISIRMTRSSTNIPWGVGFRQNGNEVVVDFLDKGSIAEKAGLNRTDRLIEFQHSSLLAPDALSISRDLERLLEVSMKLKRFVSFPQGIPWNLDGNGRNIEFNTFDEGHNKFHGSDRFQSLGGYNSNQNFDNKNNSNYYSHSNFSHHEPSISNYNRSSNTYGGSPYTMDHRTSSSSPYSGHREPYQYNPRNYNNVSPDARLANLYGNYGQSNDGGHMIHHSSAPQSDCFKRISKALGTPCY
uniref:PDZ domain-containing protein n=1 Tax=Strongyloides venezuelensis TaxID=75913 RepID=A0A0K0F2H7_STRVS